MALEDLMRACMVKGSHCFTVTEQKSMENHLICRDRSGERE